LRFFQPSALDDVLNHRLKQLVVRPRDISGPVEGERFFQFAGIHVKRTDLVALSRAVVNLSKPSLFVRKRALESRRAIAKFLSSIGHW
jgi:hypothetical protein